MQHRIVRKGFVVGIIGILILVCIPQNVSAEELPDLIIEDIRIDPGGLPGEEVFRAKVTNIGDGPTDRFIEIQIDVIWVLFGIFPIKNVYSSFKHIIIGSTIGLEPGEYQYLSIVQDYELPRFGSYRFDCNVNPNLVELENNYSNNYYSEKFFAFNQNWD